jgi:uncharacterized tellurite resistance protein B-like protein
MLAALRDFLHRLGVEETGRRFDPDDTRLAVAALLVHSIAIDGEVSEAERAKLREILQRSYGVSGGDLDELIAEATAAEGEAVDLYRFTSQIKNQLSEDERIRVVENLWEIVYADGTSHEFEENLIWRVAELLAVNRRDRIAAKRHVAETKSNGDGEAA